MTECTCGRIAGAHWPDCAITLAIAAEPTAEDYIAATAIACGLDPIAAVAEWAAKRFENEQGSAGADQ